MSNVRKQGFLDAYHGGTIPHCPERFSDDDRMVWLKGWVDGRLMARRHHAEVNVALERLTEETVS